MASVKEEIAAIRNAVAEFDRSLALPVVNLFDALAPLLRQISELVHTVDLSHLSNVPVKNLAAISDQIHQALECVTEFIVPSYPAEERIRNQTWRPEAHIRNQTNINSHRGRLENVHRDLFQLVGPIVSQQQSRLAGVTSATPVEVESGRSVATSGQNVWRYMPLRNLLRAEASCGIWMVPLERLRTWSAPNTADIREGDVPPIVEQLKREYESAVAGGREALDGFKTRHSFSDQDMLRLTKSLNFSFERQNTFVSSWSRKASESMTMWSAYGDAGKGIALRSDIGKLLAGEWRIPLSLSGLNGPNRFSGLMLREVRYLNFNESDSIPSLDDLHLPLLKRSEFEDEREVRLLGFTKNPIPSQGFPLHCNLHNIVTEIVVGPQADFDTIVAELNDKATDLRGIPIVPSTLSRSTG